MADSALPVRSSHAHAALAADPVAAASAHSARVPELSQGPLAAGAGPLPVLPGKALGTFPTELLELMFHPPEIREDGGESMETFIKCHCSRSFQKKKKRTEATVS